MSTRAHTVPRFYLNGFAAPESESSSDPFVWLGSLATSEVKRRSPKNISIARGLYDGPGAFDEPGRTIEAHLSKIESEAAPAIRRFVAASPTSGFSPPAEIWRFLAWQAARTPGWIETVQGWMNDWEPDSTDDVLEPPPEGFDSIKDRKRGWCLEDPQSGRRSEIHDRKVFEAHRKRGWKWVLRSEDTLELIHMQAWYFQVRHFPRLSWVRLNTPNDEWFITSDRAVTWLVDGFAETPPAALRHPAAQVVAALTRGTALVGRNEAGPLNVTPREVNRFTASTASEWIAGPTRDVVEQALRDRASRGSIR